MMKRPIAWAMTLILVALGLLLLAMGIIYPLSGVEGRRNTIALTLFCGFLFLLITGSASSRSTDDDYRTVFTVAIALLSIGLALLGAFFAFIWYMVSPSAYSILLAAFLVSYGLALIALGAVNHFLSQRVYRVYAFDFIRSLPHIYYRYRT